MTMMMMMMMIFLRLTTMSDVRFWGYRITRRQIDNVFDDWLGLWAVCCDL